MRDLFKSTKNKKSKILLYQNYLSQVNDETTKNDQSKQKKGKNKKAEMRFPKYIGIAAVAHGSGASHLAYAIAHYIATVQKRNVVVVSESPVFFEDVDNFKSERIPHPETIEKTDIYIQDYGCLEDMSKEQKDSYRIMEKKILCCNYSDYYLEILASFVRSYVKETDQWMFVFNHLTLKNQKDIADLMEGYHFICPPVYDRDDTETVGMLLKEVFGK